MQVSNRLLDRYDVRKIIIAWQRKASPRQWGSLTIDRLTMWVHIIGQQGSQGKAKVGVT